MFRLSAIGFSGMLALSLCLGAPALGQTSTGWVGESFRNDHLRATESLNRTSAYTARERAAASVRADQARAQASVQKLRQNAGHVYQVNNQRRVSVAEPRRVEHQPVRVQRQRVSVDAAEQRTAQLAASYSQAGPVLQEVASYPYPQADDAWPATAAASAVHVTPSSAAERISEARYRADAAVRQASHRNKVYAGYHHTHRPVVHPHITRHHYRRDVHHYRPPVVVHRHYYHPRPRYHANIHYSYRASTYCPPVRHHRFKGSGASFKFHLRF